MTLRPQGKLWLCMIEKKSLTGARLMGFKFEQNRVIWM